MGRRSGRLVAAAVTTVALTACGNGSLAAQREEPSVVAAFYPLAFAAERVAGEHATVTNLTAPGSEPHDLELSPQQVAELSEADLVVYESGFQPAVDAAVEQNAQGLQLDVAEVVGAEAAADQHPATDGEEDHAGQVRADVVEGDPHIWQDPTRFATVVVAVAEALARADPDHAEAYADNAASLVADLERLDREFATTLRDCDRRTFVTSHAAFGYLADRYGLEMVAIGGLSPDAEPSPARLRELDRVVREDGITTVFAEPLASPEIAHTLADEVGVDVAVLDPIEGLTDDTADEDYFSLMRANLRALADANGCA